MYQRRALRHCILPGVIGASPCALHCPSMQAGPTSQCSGSSLPGRMAHFSSRGWRATYAALVSPCILYVACAILRTIWHYGLRCVVPAVHTPTDQITTIERERDAESPAVNLL